MTTHTESLAGLGLLLTSLAACSGNSVLESTGAAVGDGSATSGSGGGGGAAQLCFQPAGVYRAQPAAGTDCGAIDGRCPKNAAVAIAGMADGSACAGGFPFAIATVQVAACAGGYRWSPDLGVTGRGSLSCSYGTDGALVSSLACANGGGDAAGDCTYGGVVGDVCSAGQTWSVNLGCRAVSGTGTSDGGVSGRCPGDYDAAMASLASGSGCAPDVGAVTVESCGAYRTWGQLGGASTQQCVYGSDGALVGSVSCAGACASAGVAVDARACTAVSASACNERGADTGAA